MSILQSTVTWLAMLLLVTPLAPMLLVARPIGAVAPIIGEHRDEQHGVPLGPVDQE